MNTTHPIAVKTKSELAFDALRDMIINGQIQQNRIYTVAELGEMLGISRTPLAKAITRLAEQGVIKTVAKAGIMVLPLSMDDLEEHAHLVTQVAKLVVEWVTQRCTNQEIRKLDPIIETIKQSIECSDQEGYFAASKEFHLILCQLAHAGHCRRFFEQYCDYEGWYCYKLAENKQALLSLAGDRSDMVDAMCAGDLSRALDICDLHKEKCIALLKRHTAANNLIQFPPS